MAAQQKCEVTGCQTKFIPGKTGAGGRCGRHYRLKKRNSPNAEKPGRLRDGSRNHKIGSWVSEETAERIRAVAEKQGLNTSEWIAAKCERALKAEEKKLGLK